MREERKYEDVVSLIFQKKKKKNCDADFFSPKQNVVSGQSDVTSKHHLRPGWDRSFEACSFYNKFLFGLILQAALVLALPLGLHQLFSNYLMGPKFIGSPLGLVCLRHACSVRTVWSESIQPIECRQVAQSVEVNRVQLTRV